MRKLKLDVDALQVESFVASPYAAKRGTVQGQVGDQFTLPFGDTATGPTEGPMWPDEDSTDCDGGCWGSMGGTCEGCPTVGTCPGPTYCCQPTWRPTCDPSCNMSCDPGCPP